MKTVISWENKFSGEKGYVKSVSKKKGYFENTFDVNEAKVYKSAKTIAKDMDAIKSFGELDNNMFFSVNLDE